MLTRVASLLLLAAFRVIVSALVFQCQCVVCLFDLRFLVILGPRKHNNLFIG